MSSLYPARKMNFLNCDQFCGFASLVMMNTNDSPIPNTPRTNSKRSEEGFALYMTAFSLLFFWVVFLTPQPVISSTYQILVNTDRTQSGVQLQTSTLIQAPFPWEPDGSALSLTSSAPSPKGSTLCPLTIPTNPYLNLSFQVFLTGRRWNQFHLKIAR